MFRIVCPLLPILYSPTCNASLLHLEPPTNHTTGYRHFVICSLKQLRILDNVEVDEKVRVHVNVRAGNEACVSTLHRVPVASAACLRVSLCSRPHGTTARDDVHVCQMPKCQRPQQTQNLSRLPD